MKKVGSNSICALNDIYNIIAISVLRSATTYPTMGNEGERLNHARASK